MNIYLLILLIIMLLLDAASAWIIRKHVKLIAALQAEVGQLTSEIPAELHELFSMTGKIDQFLVSQFFMGIAANTLTDKEWPNDITIEDNIYPISEYLIGATLRFGDKSYEIDEIDNKKVRLKKI